MVSWLSRSMSSRRVLRGRADEYRTIGEDEQSMAAINHLSPPTGQIAENIVGFARALRAAGIPSGQVRSSTR